MAPSNLPTQKHIKPYNSIFFWTCQNIDDILEFKKLAAAYADSARK